MNQPHPNEPYRAQVPGPGFSGMKPTLRWSFAAIVAFMGLGFFVACVSWTAAMIMSEHTPNHEPDGALMGIGMAGFFGLILLLYAQIAVGLVWVHRAWSWLPWDQRYTKHWKSWLQPSQVALMLLIPYFHYYWMFVANCGLCDALDRLRVSYPTREPAPKTLAIVACVCQLIVPFPIGSVMWLIFMSKVEKMTREMSATMGPRSTNAF